MIEALEEFLRNRWTTLLPGRSAPLEVRIAVLATSREPTGTRILLVFAGDEPAPSLVAKVPRHPGRLGPLEREWNLLNLLYRNMPEGLEDTLPRPLLMTHVEGAPVYLQTALPGHNLKTLMQRGHRDPSGPQTRYDIDLMDRWLDQLQSLHLPVDGFEGIDVARTLELRQPLEEVLPALWEASILTEGQGRELLARAGEIEQIDVEAGACWVHGDLWPGNVLVDGERFRILDWDGMTIGNRWADRFWFALHYGMLAHARLLGREDLGEGLRRTLFMSHPISDAVRDYLRRIVGVGGAEGSPRGRLEVLLALEAGKTITRSGRVREFDRNAPALLREWVSYPEQIRV